LREDGGVWRAVGDPKIVMEDCPLRRFTSADLEDGGDGGGIIESADVKSIYLHHTSQGDKLIGVVYVQAQISDHIGDVAQRTYIRYCDYPNGTTVSSVMKHWVYPNGLEQDLPFFLDGYRDIRFNSLNNILIAFIEPEDGKEGEILYFLYKQEYEFIEQSKELPYIEYDLDDYTCTPEGSFDFSEGAFFVGIEDINGDIVVASPPVNISRDVGIQKIKSGRVINDESISTVRGNESRLYEYMYGRSPSIKNFFIDNTAPLLSSIFTYRIFMIKTINNVPLIYKLNKLNVSPPAFDVTVEYGFSASTSFVIKPDISPLLGSNANYTPVGKLNNHTWFLDFSSCNIIDNSGNLNNLMQVLTPQSWGFKSHPEYPCLFELKEDIDMSVTITGTFTAYASFAGVTTSFILFCNEYENEIILPLVPITERPAYPGSPDAVFDVNRTVTVNKKGRYYIRIFADLHDSTASNYQGESLSIDKITINFKRGSGTNSIPIEIPLNDNLLTAQPSQFNPQEILYAHTSFVYNSRLWLGDIVKRATGVPDPRSYFPYKKKKGDNDSVQYAYAYTYIDTNSKYTTVISEFAPAIIKNDGYSPSRPPSTPTHVDNNLYALIPSTLFYNKNIYEFKIIARFKNIADTYWVIHKEKIKNSSFYTLNTFYTSVESNSRAINELDYTASKYALIITPDGLSGAVAYMDSRFHRFIPPKDSDKTREINQIVVSYLAVPFSFNVQNFYTVNAGNIRAFSTNAFSLHGNNNFGEYPVFIFTDTGIFAASVANADVAIGKIVPFSDKIIAEGKGKNADIGGTSFFIDVTGKLIIISGGQVTDISNSFWRFNSNPLTEKSISAMNAILAKHNIADLLSSYSDDNISDFMLGVTAIYLNKTYNETEVFNLNYPYRYALKMDGQTITAYKKHNDNINTGVHGFICANYPNALTFDNINQKRLRDLSEESAITNSKPFFIQTNPISNNEQQQYKINRAITQLRATNLANGDVLGAYLFMSDDGFIWKFANGVEVQGKDSGNWKGRQAFKNLNPLKSTVSAKYYIFVIAGKFFLGDYLQGLLFDVGAANISDKIR
jgi:hypothetical protein